MFKKIKAVKRQIVFMDKKPQYSHDVNSAQIDL